MVIFGYDIAILPLRTPLQNDVLRKIMNYDYYEGRKGNMPFYKRNTKVDENVKNCKELSEIELNYQKCDHCEPIDLCKRLLQFSVS